MSQEARGGGFDPRDGSQPCHGRPIAVSGRHATMLGTVVKHGPAFAGLWEPGNL